MIFWGDDQKVKHDYTVVQSQKAVSAHFTSKQILHFDFAELSD